MHTRGPPPKRKIRELRHRLDPLLAPALGAEFAPARQKVDSRCTTHCGIKASFRAAHGSRRSRSRPVASRPITVGRRIEPHRLRARSSPRYLSRGPIVHVGARPASTASSSAHSVCSTSGCCASRYHVHDRTSAPSSRVRPGRASSPRRAAAGRSCRCRRPRRARQEQREQIAAVVFCSRRCADDAVEDRVELP